MDFIYCDSSFIDKGVLHDFSLDYEASLDIERNSFSVEIPHHDSYLEIGDYLYVNGEEYGGVIEKHQINTKTGEAHFSGRTWRSILASHIIEPDSGEAYYTVSGTVSNIVNALINRLGISSLFHCETCDYLITEYQFGRYVDAYTGIINLLKTVDMKLVFRFNEQEKKCILYAEDVEDFTGKQYISSDAFDFRIERNKGYVNHIIALGQGQLEERQVVHRYLDENNHVSTTQHFFGADEIAEIYNYGNVESLEDLIKATEDKLLDGVVNDNINITINEILADIGDKFAAHDEETGIETVQYIDSKIITATDTDFSINYTAGIIKVIKVEGVNELEDYATNLQLNLVKENLSAFADEILGDIEDLQKQIDGNIATWFYDADPTLQNEPAVSWTTKQLKDEHLGDLYYNTSTGYSWRWQYANNEYSWGRISDVDVSEALRLASTAQDTADHKRRVFYTTPVPPYDKGDLWAQGSNGDILRCNKDRAEGESYNVNSDFILASKYTDDTAADAAQSSADAAQTAADNAQDAADAAQSTADTAQSTAEAAQSTADSAMTAAGNALVAANGKNKVYFQTSAPTSGMQKNDTWFDSDNDNAIYIYNGTSWVKEELGANAIANLSITNAKIANGTIQNAKIANLDAGKITSGTIDSARLNVSSIIQVGGIATTSDVQTAVEAAIQGWAVKVNYESFTKANNGELYIHGFSDDACSIAADVAGWVMWNGEKRTAPKYMINAGGFIKFNNPTYVVLRLSSASATSGTYYNVYYDGGWKYSERNATEYGGDWTWVTETDVILLSYYQPSAEGVIYDVITYNPPLRNTDISISGGVAKAITDAASAQTTANNAAPKTSAVAEEQLIYKSAVTGTSSMSGTTTWITANSDSQNTWTIKRPTYSQSYPVLFVAKQKKTVSGVVTCTTPMIDDTTTVIDGGNIITGSVTSNQIAADSINANHLAIGDLTNYATANELIPESLPVLPSSANYRAQILVDDNKEYIAKAIATQQYLMFTEYTPNIFKTGDELYYEFYAKAASATTISVNIWAYPTNTGGSSVNGHGVDISLTTTEQFYSGTIKLTATGFEDKLYYLLGINNKPTTRVQCYFRKVIIRKKSDGNLIVDGTIKGDHIDANTISVSKLTGSISNSGWKIDLDNGTLTLGSLAIGNVTNLQTTLNGKATPEDITTAVNNIEIGGGNLLLDTAVSQTFNDAITAGSYKTIDFYAMSKPYNELGLTTDDYVTISFDWTAESVPSGTVTAKVGSNVNPWEYFGIVITFDAGSSSGHVEKTYKVTSTLAASTGSKLRVRFDSSVAVSADTMQFTIANAKLEKGNKATDWSPASEDLVFDKEAPIVNMLPSIYYQEHLSGDTWVNNGVQWTVNADGSVTAELASGETKAKANSNYYLTGTNIAHLPNPIKLDPEKRYTVSGCPTGGSTTTYRIHTRWFADGVSPSGSGGSVDYDYGNGKTNNSSYGYVNVLIQILANYTFPNGAVTFYPQVEVGKTAHPYESTHNGSISASKTATSYITNISTGNGIQVHSASDTTDYVQINSGATSIYRDGTEVTKMADSEITIGKTGSTNKNVYITSDGINLRSGSTVLGNFGLDSNSKAKIVLGETSDTHTEITSTGYDIINSSNNKIAHFGYSLANPEAGTTKINMPFSTLGTRDTTAEIGGYSIAEGDGVEASGYASHAEGKDTQAWGHYSHAEGKDTNAIGQYSHAEGLRSYTNKECSHAEGLNSRATETYAHAEGLRAEASGTASHAEGADTSAGGAYSHAQNYVTTAAMDAQTAIGTFNIEDTTPSIAVHGSGTSYGNYAFIIGNGTDENARSNALTVDWNGNLVASGKVSGTNLPSSLTASRALISNGSGNIAVSAVTSTELGYLDGVTSNVQTQINKTNTVAYASCPTAADNAAKKATTTGGVRFSLQAGAIVGVKFTGENNTAQNPTLNVDNTGAKSILYNTSVITTGSLTAAGVKNRIIYYMYDGTYWVFLSWSVDNNSTWSSMGQAEADTGTLETARLISAKVLDTKIETKMAAGLLAVNESVTLNNIYGASGYLTSSNKAIQFFVPYAFAGTGTYTITSLKIVTRWVHGGYGYLRSGTNGATYTAIGSSWCSIINNGAAVRTNELSSFTIEAVQYSGFTITLNAVYPVAKASGDTTAITNNTPCSLQVQLTVKRTA